MPLGSGNENMSSGGAGQERPVVFQKVFKSGSRTYAAQVKLGSNGRKYLVLTENVRDSESQEVKKHFLRVMDQDLKEFFKMLQDTAIYLRSAKDDPSPSTSSRIVSSSATSKPAKAPRATAKPVIASKPMARGPVAKGVAAAAPKNGRNAKKSGTRSR